MRLPLQEQHLPPGALVRAYRRDPTPIAWPIADEVSNSVGLRARERSAQAIARRPLEERAFANGSMSPAVMQAFLAAAERHLLFEPLFGYGVEVGAGLGILAAAIAERFPIDAIIAVEVCRTFATETIPEVASRILADESRRVIPVWGSFDELQLTSESIDFIVELNSLHHADSLHHALTECARVLKPGGRLVCFDRAHHDGLPNWLREQMLDRVYEDQWITDNGYPPGIVLTRRENGEHEIRLSEWVAAFEAVGLQLDRVRYFTPKVTPKLAAKSVVSMLPIAIRSRLVSLPVWPDYAWAWLKAHVSRNAESARRVVIAPAVLTGFVASKPR